MKKIKYIVSEEIIKQLQNYHGINGCEEILRIFQYELSVKLEEK